MHNSIALCNSVSADRSGMAASTFLAAAAASVIRAPALSHITPPKVASLHGHATSRKSHQVSKSHITSTQTAWPRVFTNMRQNDENLVNAWNSIAQLPLEYNQVTLFAH